MRKSRKFRRAKGIRKIDHLLRTYSCETSDLIHEYYLSRHFQQQTTGSTEHGQLTVRCGFADDNTLEVNGFCLFLSFSRDLGKKNNSFFQF